MSRGASRDLGQRNTDEAAGVSVGSPRSSLPGGHKRGLLLASRVDGPKTKLVSPWNGRGWERGGAEDGRFLRHGSRGPLVLFLHLVCFELERSLSRPQRQSPSAVETVNLRPPERTLHRAVLTLHDGDITSKEKLEGELI